MKDITTRVLIEYISLLKDLFWIDPYKGTYRCSDFNTVRREHQSFWEHHVDEYLGGFQNLGFTTFHSGTLTSDQVQIDAAAYLQGEYYFNPDRVFCKQALYSDAILISDYVSDHIGYVIRNCYKQLYYDSEEGMFIFGDRVEPDTKQVAGLCLSAHELLDLEQWIKEGVIKLLPSADFLAKRYSKEYAEVERFVELHRSDVIFTQAFDHAKSAYKGPPVAELYYPSTGLFMLGETLFLQERFKIIPVYSPAMITLLTACKEVQTRILPECDIFDAFYRFESHYLANLSYDQLFRIRAEGYLENVRIFLREQYRKVLSLVGDNSDRQRVLDQFHILLQDHLQSAEKEWEKIRRDLSKDFKSEVIEKSIILFGSLFGLGASTFLNTPLIQAITSLIGAASLTELVKVIIKKRPKVQLREKLNNLVHQNALFVYFAAEPDMRQKQRW